MSSTRRLRAATVADALLLATPEYNNSIPGVFKNAIDWLSRPPADIDRCPLQFQKQLRLQEARSRLLSSSQDVAAVGFAVGMTAPRDSAASIGGCGAPPGQDGERLRQAKELSDAAY